MRYAPYVLLGAAVIFMFNSLLGCGAIFNGSTKSISVQANPSGTQVVTEPPTGEHVAPIILELERKNSYTLIFSKEGYSSTSVHIWKKTQAGIVILDIFLTGLIGVLVDALTGSWNNLMPDYVSVKLEKLADASIEGPDTIEITLTSETTSEDQRKIVVESSQPVGVSVETLP